jgi:hypothetical protein
MPVLELCALEYAAEKTKATYDALTNCAVPVKIDDVFIFGDSTIALSWVAKAECEQTKVQKRSTFINNRINKIVNCAKMVNGIKIAHVGTNDNTADYLTRLVSPKKLLESNFIQGPKFLTADLFDIDCIDVPNPCLNNDPELPKFTVAKVVTQEINNLNVGAVIDLNRYSSLRKAVRVLRQIFTCINIFKDKLPEIANTHPVVLKTHKQCELMLLESEQRSSFPEVFDYFESKSKLLKTIPQIVAQMNIVQDADGLIRVKSKMSKLINSKISTKPILLTNKSTFTKLLILDAHKKFNHCGTYFLLHQLKTKYFICKGYSAVKNVLKGCCHCKRFNMRTINSNTNSYRDWNINPEKRFFSTCFVDCFGPYNVLYGDNKVKAYGVIFKCVWSKMVNVEMVLSLDTKHFLTAFQNHIYAYGIPQKLISDEGSNFTASFEWLRQWLRDVQVIDYFSELGIEVCNFEQYPPGSLNRGIGGFIESGVALIKKFVQGAIRNNVLDFYQFSHVIKQCVCYANKRPITQKAGLREQNVDEEFLVLSPEYLQFGYELPILEVPYPNSDTDDWALECKNACDTEKLQKMLKIKNNLRDHYHSEFIYGLLDQSVKDKGKYLPINHQQIREGDIVLIKDTFVKAPNYPMARVLEVTTNSLGECTQAVLVKANKSVINRDISSLILLVRRAADIPEAAQTVGSSAPESPPQRTRSQRRAAQQCVARNRELLGDLY